MDDAHASPPAPTPSPPDPPGTAGGTGFRARPFRPAPWAPGPHAQTLWAKALRAASDPGMRRERWTTPDGDFLDVDMGPDPGRRAPLCVVLHGLEGSSRRRYVLGASRELLRHGVLPVALNLRGCSGTPNLLPRMYHSGETTDLAFVLERLRATYPGRRVGAFGFSLGANALLKLLGEREDGGTGVVDAAVAMSVPFDLAAGAELLERGPMGRLYTAYFLRSLRRKVRAKEPLLRDVIDVEAALRAGTLREFDDAATAPLHGFRDAAHYYASASSKDFIGGIRVPTLVMHALNDPLIPAGVVPYDAMESNPWLVAVLPRRGGHVGFLEGAPWRSRLWGDEEGARFLSETLAAPH